MTTKLPVDVTTLDDETLSLLIDESQKALDERKQYVPFVGEIIEVWDGGLIPEYPVMLRFHSFGDNEVRTITKYGHYTSWDHYRRLDPTRILQFRDHEPGPCPCPDEEWVHVMWKTGIVQTLHIDAIVPNSWENGDILRWCPAVGVE